MNSNGGLATRSRYLVITSYELLITGYNQHMILPLFLIPVLAGLLAQSLKPLFNKRLYAIMKDSRHHVPRYGGMPSAHSAFAFSLATIIGLVDGIWSTTFAIAAAAVILILDDALRMRIFLAGFGQALHQLVEKLPASEQAPFPYIETRLGHKPLEAVAGAALGIAVSVTLYWLVIA
jgi:acid phosphatase family membrane protein YuiD